MTLDSLTPNIMVADVNATLDFYTKTLNFELLDTNPESGVFEWGYVKSGSVGLMFQAIPSLQAEYKELENRPLSSTLTLYIRVTKIDELYASLPESVNIIKPINTTFYGMREFALMDPNGYILTFSESA